MEFLKINDYIFNNGLLNLPMLNLATKNVIELNLVDNNPIQMFYDFGGLIKGGCLFILLLIRKGNYAHN